MRLGQTNLNGNGRRVPTVELLSPGKDVVVGTLREARLAAQSTGSTYIFLLPTPCVFNRSLFTFKPYGQKSEE